MQELEKITGLQLMEERTAEHRSKFMRLETHSMNEGILKRQTYLGN